MSAPAPASARYREGLAVRRSVLGDAHVDRAEAAATDFDRPFQQLITEAAWGTVWSRPAWSKRERSMVTLALLAALGHDEEVAMHVRATANTGATPRRPPRRLPKTTSDCPTERRLCASTRPAAPWHRQWRCRRCLAP